MDDTTHMCYEILNIMTAHCSEVSVGCKVDAVLEEIGQTHVVAQ